MKKICAFLFFLLAIPVFIPSAVFADPTPLVVPSGFHMSDVENNVSGLTNEPIFFTITVVLRWLLGLIGVLGVIAFVISGILYLTSVGDEERIKQAKSIMTYAIIGLVVALIGLVVVNAVAGLTGAGDPYESIIY